jgi:iron complex outermembrane recepter protein
VSDRERMGVNATVQFRPVENLTLTLDGLYNKFSIDSTARALGSWFEPSEYTAATIDANRTITSLTTNGFADLIVTGSSRDTTTQGVGFNADWDISESLNIKFDSSWSEAADDNGGKDVFTVIGVPATYSFTQAQGDGFPSVTGYSGRGPTAGQANVLTGFAGGRAHYVQRQGNDISETVIEHRLEGEYSIKNSFITSVKAGVSFTDRDKNNQVLASNANINCLYCGYAVLLPATLLRPFEVGEFLSGGGSVPSSFPTYNAEEYLAYLTSAAATTAADVAAGRPVGSAAAFVASVNGFTATAQPQSYKVQEKNTAFYVEAGMGGDIGEMVWSGNVGVRYVRTELAASGQSQLLTDLLPVAGDLTIYSAVFAPGGSLAISKKNSYEFVLPNLNLKFEPNRQFAIRFAASRTLTRPQVSLLAPATSLNTFRPASLSGVGGNPDLKPYVSDNIDLSFEWYPTRSISLSVAPFSKKISDFIVQARSAENFVIANAGNLALNTVITGPRQATFQILRPRNIEEAEVKGVELSATITADTWLDGWMSGFGISANATLVDSDATYAPGSTSEIFALEGLGDSWNLTGFYEYGKVSARLAYNKRDRFLENVVNPSGQGNDPVYRREFGQLDGRASYQFTERLQVYFEGTNMTGEQNVQTGRFDNQVLRISDTGARYAVGARYEF